MNQTLEFKLSQLPESPGVYQMKHGGEIIYVGKAVDVLREYGLTADQIAARIKETL